MRHRLKAFLKHLAITTSALAVVYLAVFLAWYPAPYFEILATGKYTLLLAGLALGLGPLLTLLIFRPGKKGLKFDLVVIALLQVAALLYGSYQLYLRRPLYMVFAVDRFNVLVAADIDPAVVRDGPYARGPLSMPLLLVATLPADPHEREQLLVETLFQGKPDIDRRPRYWSLYSDDYLAVVEVALPLGLLRERRPFSAAAIDRLVARSGRPIDALVFHGVSGVGADHAVVLDRRDGVVVGSIGADPWLQ